MAYNLLCGLSTIERLSQLLRHHPHLLDAPVQPAIALHRAHTEYGPHLCHNGQRLRDMI